MKTSLYASAAVLALTAGAAHAAGHLPFTPGEGDFSWDGYNSFADQYDLSGATVEITGPWTGNEKEKVDNAEVDQVLCPMSSLAASTPRPTEQFKRRGWSDHRRSG